MGAAGGGGTELGHPATLKVAMRVRQLKLPFAGMYSFTYQKVQSSEGSMLRLE